MTISNGRLIGGRVEGSNPNTISVYASTNNGTSWFRVGSVATSSTSNYGDVNFASDGGTLVYCAFREQWGTNWQITVCRSTDGGNTWVFDSIVANDSQNYFLGAPFLFYLPNGEIQCYYDSELVAAQSGYPGSQWIFMNAKNKFNFGGAWTDYMGVASRPNNPAVFARDGLSSVSTANGTDLMLVCETVDPNNSSRNMIVSTMSSNNGVNWDFTSRQTICNPYKNGVEFNAYSPMCMRIGGGPIGVIFCTDTDFASPSADNLPPNQRNAHVYFMQTTNTFQNWGAWQAVDTTANSMYSPGMLEIASNVELATTDHYNGNQSIWGRG